MPEFICPDIILTGPGCLKELGRQAAEYGWRVTIVIGASSSRAGGRLDAVKQMLASNGLSADVFSGAKPEPPCEQVDQLRQHLRAKRSEIVIAIGGGSAIDLAKAAAILCKSDKSVEEHVATQKLPSESLPLIAVPTTAGSGSEATPTAVLTDTISNVKRSIRARIMMPKVAIIDPELTCSCPPRLTAVVGMDALTQAIESYCSTLATNLTEALCEKAIVLISQNLERAYRDGSDLAARTALAEGSLLAGMALANARLGAVHGLAHPIGGKADIPHGLICAVLLPAVLEFNRPSLAGGGTDKYGRLHRILGADPVNYIHNLLDTLDLPHTLKGYHIDPSLLDQLAEEGLQSGSTKANPRPVTADDLIAIARQVI